MVLLFKITILIIKKYITAIIYIAIFGSVNKHLKFIIKIDCLIKCFLNFIKKYKPIAYTDSIRNYRLQY